MSFKVEAFVSKFEQSPSITLIESLRKQELIEVATHYGLSPSVSMRKPEIRQIVLNYCFQEGILTLQKISSESKGDVLELKRLELEMKRLELEDQKEQRAHELALKENELRLKQLEMQDNSGTRDSSVKFDPTRHVKLVPSFQEKEVDKFFAHFEKVAKSLDWPKEVWTLLLQSVLIGKAQEVYSALPIEQSTDYDKVKEVILKAYELVPEAYRQKFREFQKKDGQTHVEFAREKENLLDRWCYSKEIGKDFNKFKQLIILEEFKNKIHVDIKTHLDEQKVNTMEEAAVMADDYAITHKVSSKFTPRKTYQVGSKFCQAYRGHWGDSQTYSKKMEQASADKSKSAVAESIKKGMDGKPRLSCAYCKKEGHIIDNCFRLKRNNERKAASGVPTGLSSVKPDSYLGIDHTSQKLKSDYMERYKPFISEGHVSLVGDNSDWKQIQILRDTGATQSLMLQNILPLSEESATGARVLISGIELGTLDVPLHRVNLKSDLVKGVVNVGIRESLPIEGISLLLGNDLAGDKVTVEPQVVDIPITEKNTAKLEEEFPDIFPACVVTRSMTAKTDKSNHDNPSVRKISSHIGDPSSNNETSKTKVSDSFGPDSIISRMKLIEEQEKDQNICFVEENFN